MTPPKNKRVLRIEHVALQLNRCGLDKLLVEFARHADRSRFDLRFISITGLCGLGDEIERCSLAGDRNGQTARLTTRYGAENGAPSSPMGCRCGSHA